MKGDRRLWEVVCAASRQGVHGWREESLFSLNRWATTCTPENNGRGWSQCRVNEEHMERGMPEYDQCHRHIPQSRHFMTRSWEHNLMADHNATCVTPMTYRSVYCHYRDLCNNQMGSGSFYIPCWVIRLQVKLFIVDIEETGEKEFCTSKFMMVLHNWLTHLS